MSLPFFPGELDLLVKLNSWHSPVADAFMFMISNVPAWTPMVAVLLWFIFYRRPWQEGVLLLLSVGICILICDRLSSGLAKPYCARLRPSHIEELKGILHLVYNYKGHIYGFFSGHASNFFAVATLLSLIIRSRRFTLLLYGIVSLVAYSRLYLGVHAITDILAGVAIGILVGAMVHRLYHYLRTRYLVPRIYRVSTSSIPSTKQVFAPRLQILEWVMLAFPFVLLCFAWQIAIVLERVNPPL